MIKIEKWIGPDEQCVTYEDKCWNVAYLHQMAKDLPVMEIPLEHLRIDYEFGGAEKMLEFLAHMKSIIEANMDYPIILAEDGYVMDGRHRIAKALLEGHPTIKAVRFDKNPRPTRYEDSKED